MSRTVAEIEKHDPLCVMAVDGVTRQFCHMCEFITKVRVDMRERCAEAATHAVLEVNDYSKGELWIAMRYDCCGCRTYDDIARDAINAVREVEVQP